MKRLANHGAARMEDKMTPINQTPTPSTPFIVMTASAAMPNSCKGIYRRVAVVETDGSTRPKMISERARGVKRLVRRWERCHAGSHGGNTAYDRAGRVAINLAAHLNLMHQVRLGQRQITVADIDGQENAELQRELVDAYGGFERYLADAGAVAVHQDETGTLVRRETSGEAIVAVQVVCPSTGRQYALRVPPATKTAREGVAWTFGVDASAYNPTVQS
jgi:hypothetical protein